MKTAKLFIIYLVTLVVLTACGGGSAPLTRDEAPDTDDGSSGGGTNSAFSITLSMTDAGGNTLTQLSDGSPITLSARVENSSGTVQQGVVVTFVLSQVELATFNNDTGTALTNDQGIASLQMTVGSLSGSGTVTASTTNSPNVTMGFESTGTRQQVPFSLEIFGSATQLASSGGDEIELIAVVKNEQNILLPNIAVSFAADEDASIANVDAVTQADGTARARLSTQNNKRNRDITVTASTSALQETLTVKVVGTEININGSGSVIINDTTPITIVLSDSDGNGIANQEVVVTTQDGLLNINNEPGEQSVSIDTSQNGQATINFSASVGGDATITATALEISRDYEITVQQDAFSFIDLPTQSVELNTPTPIKLSWQKNGVPFPNGTVTLTSSRGQFSVNGAASNTVTTDSAGIATLSIQSEFAGPTSISAIGSDGNANNEVVTARAEIEFIATTVNNVFVDATPDLIGPEGQTSTITALLRDGSGNLVKDKVVNFSLESDASGGSISPNSATTDSNGIASTVYTSNAVSGNNGVQIRAESDGVSDFTLLTVGDRAFDISLGTGSIIEIPDSSTYMKEFAIFVTDSSGRPVEDVELTATVTPVLREAYYKGSWIWDEVNRFYTTVNPDGSSRITATCVSEDLNQNGRLDLSEDANGNGVLDAGEDADGDGQLDLDEDVNGDGQLTPGNVATINFKDNITRTNDFGQATVQVRYPKEFGRWTNVEVAVFGQSSGSESMQSQEFRLSVAASDLTTQAIPPRNSPFGQSTVCTDAL